MAGGRRFVVVEIDADVRRIYARKLQVAFAESVVIESDSCAGALHWLAERPVDAVVVNHRAVDVEGVAIILRIRRDWPGIPLIAIGEAPLRSQALDAGATVFVEANAWATLADAVQNALAAREA